MPDWVVRAAKRGMQWLVRSGEARTPAVEITCPRSSAELRSPTRVYWLDANAIFGSSIYSFYRRREWINLLARALGAGQTLRARRVVYSDFKLRALSLWGLSGRPLRRELVRQLRP